MKTLKNAFFIKIIKNVKNISYIYASHCQKQMHAL